MKAFQCPYCGVGCGLLWDEGKIRGDKGHPASRGEVCKKPLYYCTPTPGLFLFASEVRALLQSGLVARRLDPAGLEVFLWNGFLVAPLTLVAGVRSLLPGHCLRVSADGQVDQPVGYWRLPAHPSASDRRDIQEMIRACLEEAVALRLVSDVPLGAFLSGGLDSSTIVALMARASDRVKTFSIVLEEKPYDERAFARWVANRFGTGHTEVEITRQQFCTWLPAALAALDQPTFDGLNTYCVARAAKESGLTVALSGLGGDELFGGYPFFKTGPSLAEMVRLLNILPRTVLRPLATWLTRSPVRLSGPWKLLEATNNLPDIHQVTVRRVCAYQIAQCLFPTWVRRRLYVDSLPVEKVSFGLPHEFLAFLSAELAASEPPQETLSRLALRLFLGERCLRDTDTTSMAVSLEVRAPFTDHSLIETVWAVPAPQRCAGSPNKPFQWTLVKPYLGPDYPVRPKQGFTFPFQEWLHERQVFDIIQTTLGDATLLQEIGLDPSAVQQLMNAFQRSGSALPWSRLWALFVLCYWCAQNRVRL